MANTGKFNHTFDNDTIIAEAASWVAQIDGAKITDADRLALREWAARSPRHLVELKQLGDMWCDIDELLSGPTVETPTTRSLFAVLFAGTRYALRLFSVQ